MRSVACSHAGRYSCTSRSRERRCCSALRASAKPQSASGVFRRTAVSVSCTGFLERRCISTSPAATSGRPVRSASASRRSTSSESSAYSSNSTATAARSANVACSQRACASRTSGGSSRRGINSAWQPGAPRRCGAPLSRSRTVSRYCPLAQRKRASVISSHRSPYPSRWRAISTSRQAGVAPSACNSNWLPISSLIVWPVSLCRLASSCARTTPATEHSSVIAMAA